MAQGNAIIVHDKANIGVHKKVVKNTWVMMACGGGGKADCQITIMNSQLENEELNPWIIKSICEYIISRISEPNAPIVVIHLLQDIESSSVSD